VLENYWDLNFDVNEAYLKPFKTKNFFFCIEENEWNYIRKKYPNPWETY